MTPAITLQELLVWNQESSDFWHAHLEANPALLELPLRHRRNQECARVCAPHLGGGTALEPAHCRAAGDAEGGCAYRAAGCAVRPSSTGRSSLQRSPERPRPGLGSNQVAGIRLASGSCAQGFTAQADGARTVSQSAPLGATGYAGAGGRFPLEIPGRRTLQFSSVIASGSGPESTAGVDEDAG